MRAQFTLPGAQLVVADQLGGTADRLGEAAAVVVAARRGAVGDAVRNGVAQPQLDGVDAELARRVVDQRLARRLAGRPADAAVRRGLALVRERRVDLVAHVLDVVEARQERGRAERVDEARPRMPEIGAAVADVAALQGEEAAVGVGCQLELADDLLGVPARGQRLVAVLDPLDRRAQAARQLGDDGLLDEQVHLEAEAAPDGRADHPHARVLQPELRRQHGAHEERHLRRRPDRDRALGHVPICDHAAALERRGVGAPEVEALAEDVRGARERPVDVARLELDVREVVVAQLVVQQLRPRRECLLRVEHRRQRVILDVDQLGRVLGDGARRRDDGGDRLAHETHAVEREHVAGAGLGLRSRRDRCREGRQVAQVLAADDQGDPVEGARPRDVDRDDPSVGVGAAAEGDVQRARRLDVVEVDAAACQEARVLDSHDAGADVAAGHRAPSLSACPAWCTASTMPT